MKRKSGTKSRVAANTTESSTGVTASIEMRIFFDVICSSPNVGAYRATLHTTQRALR
jgi:hypothetical protein